MSYKFQRGKAVLSGSMIIEEEFEANGMKSLGKVSGSSDLEIGGTVRLDGVADAALDVAADSFYYMDGDKLMKRDTMADYATAIAGDGLAASSGVLAVGVDDSTIELNSDALRLKDNGVTLAKLAGITRGSIILGDASGDPSLLAKGTAAQFLQSDGTDPSYVSFSGDATVAAGGALTIADNAVTLAKMAGLTRGSLILGDASGDPSALAKGTAAQFLQSDGTDPSYVSISGDATIAAGGALTIAAAAVEHGMLNDNIISGQDELAHADIADADELMISDAGTIKRVGIDSLQNHYFAAISGDATVADGGALTIAANAVEDSMVNDNVATGLAGDGLSAASGVMAVAVSGAVHITNDKVCITGSIAGNGLKAAGGSDAISSLKVDADPNSFNVGTDGLTLASSVAGTALDLTTGVLHWNLDGLTALGGTGIAQTDNLVFSDDGTEKKITFSNFEDAIFGNVSGDATIAAGGALTIGANAVEGSMINSNAAGDGIAYSSNSLQLDLNELTAAVVDVAADSIAIVDANDSNKSRKESIADLVTAMAGAGLTATSGVLKVTSNNVNLKADSEALVEGYNYFADASANATVTLPASPSVGDVVVAKAGNLTSGAKILINKGSDAHRIDGEESITIESPYGAITMVYVVANAWRIV